jgi:hypothetical protein
MNKLLLFLSLGLMAAGCSKSSTNPSKTKTSTTTGLTGTYVDFKSIDTVYNNQLVSDGIESITIKSAYGDTSYWYPGTANAKAYYNNIQNYNPKSATQDTIKFTSSTTAYETNTFIDPLTFTYNLKAGTFNDGTTIDGSTIIERIVQVNPTTIELIENEQSGNLTGDVSANYYRKQ